MEFLSLPELSPFVFFAFLVFFFLILEFIFSLIGLDSSLDQPDIDVPSWDAGPDISDLGHVISDASLLNGIEVECQASTSVTSIGGLLDILGLRRVSLTIWLTLFSANFAGSGIFLQSLADGLFGSPFPAWVAVLIVTIPVFGLTGIFADTVGRLLPQMETSAISERSFGRRRGMVTIGTAKRGMPVEVRFNDSHGNLHYIMAEPFEDDVEIPAGHDVLIIRLRSVEDPEPRLRLIPLS